MGLIPREPKPKGGSSGGGKTKTTVVNHYHGGGGGGGGGQPLETWEILVIVFSIVWTIYFICCIVYYKKKEDKEKHKHPNDSTGQRARRILFNALLLAFILPYIIKRLYQAIRANKGSVDRSNDTGGYNSPEDQAALLPQSQSQPQMQGVTTADPLPQAYTGAGAGDGQRFEPMRVPTLPVHQQGEYNPDAAAAYVGGPSSSSSNAQPSSSSLQRPRSPLNV